MESSRLIGITFTDVKNGAYRLEQLSKEVIPNTWNVSHFKFYFSWNTLWPGCKDKQSNV